jgi:hypothetical protein
MHMKKTKSTVVERVICGRFSKETKRKAACIKAARRHTSLCIYTIIFFLLQPFSPSFVSHKTSQPPIPVHHALLLRLLPILH